MGDRFSASTFYNRAVTAINDQANPNRLGHAYQLFASACLADPTWWEAWYQLGNNNSDMNLYPAAIACWRRSLECLMTVHDRARVLCNLGWRLHGVGKTQEALEASVEAVALDPNLVNGWLNLSLIHGTLGDSTESVACARKAYALDQERLNRVHAPDDPNILLDRTDSVIEMALAFSLLFDGQYQEGFKHFECRFRYKLRSFLQFPYPKWEGAPDKTVYLVADQGLGDTISFARFVEATAKTCRYVHIAIQPVLYRLFTNAFLHLKNVNILPQPCPFPQADYWTTFVSLPSALNLPDEEVVNAPHIRLPNINMPLANWRVPDRKLHIGIAWAGSPLNDIDKHRNIPLSMMLELCRVEGVQLYSLQIGPRAQDLIEQGVVATVRDLAPYIQDVVDTIGVLKHLDLVITCESALGHICALAGKECWIPYSWLGRDYRGGNLGEKLLWTPQHQFFRQGPDMDWKPVFARMINVLNNRLA